MKSIVKLSARSAVILAIVAVIGFAITACDDGSTVDLNHKHTFAAVWKSNTTQHWHECSCGEKSGTANHTYNWIITTPATETAEGLKTETCTVCGAKSGSTQTIPKIEPNHTHTFTTDWKSDSTQHWHECACGEKSGTANHAWGAWTVTKAATTTAEGVETRTCTVCKETETNPIAKLESVTITWNLNGGTGGGAYPTTIAKGTPLAQPTAPTKTNATFQGWFTTAAMTGTAYNFNANVNANLTLYAKWQQTNPMFYWGTFWPNESASTDRNFKPFVTGDLVAILNGGPMSEYYPEYSGYVHGAENGGTGFINGLQTETAVKETKRVDWQTTHIGYWFFITPYELSGITSISGESRMGEYEKVIVSIDGIQYYIYHQRNAITSIPSETPNIYIPK